MAKDSDEEKYNELMRRGQEALDRSRNVSSRKPSSDIPLPSENTLSAASEDLRRQHAERFSLDQKIRADLHDMAMNLAGRGLKSRTESEVPASNGVPTREAGIVGKSSKATNPIPQFPNRASWLKGRMLERGWGNADPAKFRGPDRKTIEKMLRSESVRNDVLEKLAEALSLKYSKVSVLDIPPS